MAALVPRARGLRSAPQLVLLFLLLAALAGASSASSSSPPRRALLQKTNSTNNNSTTKAATTTTTTTATTPKPKASPKQQPKSPTNDVRAATTLSASAQRDSAVVQARNPFFQQPTEPTPVAAAEGTDPDNVDGGSASAFVPGSGPATAIAQAAPFDRPLYGFGGSSGYGATLGGPNPFFYGGSGGAWGWTGGRFAG